MMFSTALILRSLTVFGVVISFGNAASALMGFPTSLPKGFFMKYKIMPSEFSSSTEKVSFNFSTECNYPELPSWLHLEQRRASAPAFFYGAPGNWDKSTKLEVIGWDKTTYSTETKIQDIDITDDGFPYFQAEFFIKNRTLDQFLLDEDDKKIVDAVRKYWSPSDLDLTMVISAIGHGGRVPLPGSNNHEGVIVRVGSSEMWPGDNSTLPLAKNTSDDRFKDKGFEVDWTRFSWIDLRSMENPEAERQALLPPDSIVRQVSYTPPAFDDSARDFDMDFIFVIVIPIVVILIFVLILSIIMCFGREGRRKRDQQTPHIKLTHHHNIQRSTLRLRELSKPRDQDPSPKSSPSPGPTGPRHTHGDYERLDDGDDDRTDGRNAPPPYRMPPGSAGRGPVQQV